MACGLFGPYLEWGFLIPSSEEDGHEQIYCKKSIIYLTPFNFRPPLIFGRGWPKIRGAEKVSIFLGGRKLKGPKFFQNPSKRLKQRRKMLIIEGDRK